MATTQYIGARYVPIFADPAEWNNTRTYEPLTVVLNEGNSYTSKQYVPKGIDIANADFWAETGNYNAQVEAYRQDVERYATQVNDISAALNAEVERAKTSEETLSAVLKQKPYYFKNTTEMQEYNLAVGDYAITEAFSNVNGGGCYIIVSGVIANNMDTIELKNGNIAKLITSGSVNIDALGAADVSDASEIINYALDAYTHVYGYGSYLTSKTLVLAKSNHSFYFNEIKSTAENAISLNCKSCKVIGNALIANGTGVIFGEKAYTEYTELSISLIKCKIGIKNSENYATQYCNIHDIEIQASTLPIDLQKHLGSKTWFNENFFNNIKCYGDCDWGVKIVVEHSDTGFLNSQLEENIFTNITFEWSCGGIYLEDSRANIFLNMRTNEIPTTKKVIKMVGNCMRNKFTPSDKVPIALIDTSENTGSRTSNDYNSINNIFEGIISFKDVYINNIFVFNKDTIGFHGTSNFEPESKTEAVTYELSLKNENCFYNKFNLNNNEDVTIILKDNYSLNGIDVIYLLLKNTKLTLQQGGNTIYASASKETANKMLVRRYDGYWTVI